MNEKEQLLREIEQAPDFLVKEVLDFLLFTKSRTKYLKLSSDRSAPHQGRDRNLEIQLREMAQDREIQAEIKTINQEFLVTEIDGLS